MASTSEASSSSSALPIDIERLGINEVTPEILKELEILYARAYFNSTMHTDLAADVAHRPEVFQLFIARAGSDIVGARAIEYKPIAGVDYLDHEPINGKRFAVDPKVRRLNVGRRLLLESNAYCFNELDLALVFGESNEIGALAMYGANGAHYERRSIEDYSHRNSPQVSLEAFAAHLTYRVFRNYRLTGGEGVRYAYPRDSGTTQTLIDNGYISKDELLSEYGPVEADAETNV